MTHQNIMVMGAGGVGGYFGGKLSGNDNLDVSFVARGEHLRMIQERGLIVKSVEGDFTVSVPASDHPSDLPAPDLILFTVKSYDTEKAIEQIRTVVSPSTQILPLQNGIENLPKLESAFSKDRVIPAICRIGVRIEKPGVLSHTHPGSLWIGERDGNPSGRLKKVQELFSDVGVSCRISAGIEREMWRKFAWNAIFNMLTAAENQTTDFFYNEGEPVDQLWKLAEELQLIAEAEKSGLSWKDLKDVIWETRNNGAFVTSTLHDRRRGKQLEYDAFTGALLRLGEKHDIRLPEYLKLHRKLKKVNEQLQD